MLFEFDKPGRDDLLGYIFVNVFDVLPLPAYTLRLFSFPPPKLFNLIGDSEANAKPDDFKYLFDIVSYTEFLFYCTDVYADAACVITFAIFYMKARGFVCVQMQKEFRWVGYSPTKVVFGLYLCNDLDQLLRYKNLSDRFYGTMAPNSKQHIPKVYDSDFLTNSDAKTVAFWSSSHFCFQ